MLKISKEEKKIQFIYLLTFWVVMGVLFCYVCFHNYSNVEIRSKELIIAEINKKNTVFKSQLDNVSYVDSLSRWVALYQPSTSQVSLTNSISTELEELKKIYEAKRTDANYKIFNQLYVFYSMPFFDKKATWNSTNNTTALKKELDNCMIGFKQKQDNLNLKNVLSSQANKK